MIRVAVTGAGGFIGANLVRRLLEEGHEVWALVRPGGSTWRLTDVVEHLRTVEVDVGDVAEVRRLMATVRPQWIFDLAAHGAYSWQTDLDAMLRTNVHGIVHLLEAAQDIGVEAFVHAGTSSEYGVKAQAPGETEWLEPNSHYAVTKASAGMFCQHAGRSTGLPTRSLRLYSAYGPWEEPNRLMPRLAACGLAGRLPALVDPATARDFVHVGDVVDAFLAAATTPGQEPGAVYNVGTGRQTALRDVVELYRNHLGIDEEPAWGTMPPRIWDTGTWVAAPDLADSVLGWRPRIVLEEGVRMLCGWMAEHPGLWDRYGVPVAERPGLRTIR